MQRGKKGNKKIKEERRKKEDNLEGMKNVKKSPAKGEKEKREAAAKIDGGKVKGKEDEGTANVILEKGRGNEKSRSRPQWHLACGRPGFASF